MTRSWSAEDPADSARVKEAVDLTKRIGEDDVELAAWAANLLKSRDEWRNRQRKREQQVTFPT